MLPLHKFCQFAAAAKLLGLAGPAEYIGFAYGVVGARNKSIEFLFRNNHEVIFAHQFFGNSKSYHIGQYSIFR